MLQTWFIIHTLFWSKGVEIGGSLLSLNVILLVPLGLLWLLKSPRVSRTTLIASAVFATGILLSLAAAKFGPCEDKFSKAIISFPLLAILLVVGLEIGSRSTYEDWQKLRTTASRILLFASVTIIAEIFLPAYFSPDKIKYHTEFKFSGIFNEPSHVAVSLFPCIAILLSSSKNSYNRNGILALLFLFVVSRSSTLFMLTFCYIAYRIIIQGKMKQGAKYTLIVGFIISIAAVTNYQLLIEPTVSRFMGVTSSQNENLSSLIYLKGWQDGLANISRTFGFGLGFNMMGCIPLPDVPIRDLLSVPGSNDLNNEDGSFLLSKLMSEFGIFGILFFLWVIFYWIRYEKTLKEWQGTFKDISTLQTLLMFSFVATSLLRSTGYFQGGLLLWATAFAGSSLAAHKQKSIKMVGQNS